MLQTADMAASRVPGLIFHHEMFAAAPAAAIAGALVQFDREYCAETNADDNKDSRDWGAGTTALVVVRRGTRLFIGHLGDSRAVMARNGEAIPLSHDHTPETDIARIQGAGGWVTIEREMQYSRLKDMDLHDPDVKRLAQDAVKWHNISRVNGELGAFFLSFA